MEDKDKLACPFPECLQKASGVAQLKRHFIGKHLKDTRSKLLPIEQRLKTIDESLKKVGMLIREDEKIQIVRDMMVSLYEEFEPATDEKSSDSEIIDGTIIRDIELYLPKNSDKCPVCREERQYAHRLAMWLEARTDATIIEGTPVEGIQWNRIKRVYFEATFMRDIWSKSDSKRFNMTLYEFVQKYVKEKMNLSFDEKQYGTKDQLTSKHPNHWDSCHPMARWMMNAKPDLAVLTDDNVLHFIECKYESDEDCYFSKDKGFKLGQIEVQKAILDFLVNQLELKFGDEENRVTVGQVIPLRFYFGTKPKQNSDKQEWWYADIQKLLSSPFKNF